MTAQRVYKYATVFNARVVNMRNLWEPSREYMGKPTEKPNYLASVIVPKTRANWFEEPQFAGFTQAGQELYGAAMSHIPFPQVIWPVKDGDIPEPGKNPVEWMRGHWYLTGSSSSPINVEIVQGGVPVKLANRATVKPGDFVAASVALAVKQNDPRGVKCYLNSVLFMGAGEEIAIGNSVSGAELMAQARAQGLNVTGFGTGAGGFVPPQPQGFTPPATSAPQQGFSAPSGAPSGFGAPAPAPVQPQQGFTAPQGFGFPQR